MSAFGDWWVGLRNRVETAVQGEIAAVEPAAEAALVTAVKAGVAGALAKGGTPGDMWVGARDAATQILQTQGVSIAKSVIEQAVTEHLTPATPAAS